LKTKRQNKTTDLPLYSYNDLLEENFNTFLFNNPVYALVDIGFTCYVKCPVFKIEGSITKCCDPCILSFIALLVNDPLFDPLFGCHVSRIAVWPM